MKQYCSFDTRETVKVIELMDRMLRSNTKGLKNRSSPTHKLMIHALRSIIYMVNRSPQVDNTNCNVCPMYRHVIYKCYAKCDNSHIVF